MMEEVFSEEQKAAAETLEAEGIAPEYAAELATEFAANVPAALAHYREAKARGNATPGLLAYAVRYGLQPSQPQTAPAETAPSHAGGAYEPVKIAPELPEPQTPAEERAQRKSFEVKRRIARLWPYIEQDAGREQGRVCNGCGLSPNSRHCGADSAKAKFCAFERRNRKGDKTAGSRIAEKGWTDAEWFAFLEQMRPALEAAEELWKAAPPPPPEKFKDAVPRLNFNAGFRDWQERQWRRGGKVARN